MKPDKVPCCMFLFTFAFESAQNTIVVYSVLRNKLVQTCWLRNSCIVYERKTKDCAPPEPSNINLGIVVYSFDVCRVS